MPDIFDELDMVNTVEAVLIDLDTDVYEATREAAKELIIALELRGYEIRRIDGQEKRV